MIQWTYQVSWNNFKKALDCPKQIMYQRRKVPGYYGMNWHSNLGHVVQKVFECYCNQGLYKVAGMRTEKVLLRALDLVLASRWFEDLETKYSEELTELRFKEEAREQVVNGLEQVLDLGMLDKVVKSEVNWWGQYNGVKLSARFDFEVHNENQTLEIWDGKGNQVKNADPRQLKFYWLLVHLAGLVVSRLGFIYWRHDCVDIEPEMDVLKEFLDKDMAKGIKIFRELRVGVEELEATPGHACRFCNWRGICEDAVKEVK